MTGIVTPVSLVIPAGHGIMSRRTFIRYCLMNLSDFLILICSLQNEKFVPPADNHNITGQVNPAIHSTTGINFVSMAGNPTPIDSRVIQTTQQLSEEFPFNLDMNSGKPLGVGASFQALRLRNSLASQYCSKVGCRVP